MTPESGVSFVTVRRRFDFRSIEVGRWVTPQERDRAAGRFYQALCVLMTILRGPEPLISLRSTLGLQYGIGGRLGVAAHYIPATRQLALAKNAGAGSLAHEWFTPPLIITWAAKLTGMPDRAASLPVPG